MRIDAEEFSGRQHKVITLLGMSGVGKTTLARTLRRHNWFHYSGDYRIGTRYLNEQILDDVKREAMASPFLRELLRSDSIHIANNLSVDNLKPLSMFLGKLGNPEQGGIALTEFKRRQAQHRAAEIGAMHDVPEFLRKAREVYRYDCFVNDAGGSLVELDDTDVIELLARESVILYIEASEEDEQALMRRAEEDPKPMYYPEAFLDENLRRYMDGQGIEYVALIDPDDFVRWVFPRLFRARLPRYRAIAQRYGYTVSTGDLRHVHNEQDFLDLMDSVLRRGPGSG